MKTPKYKIGDVVMGKTSTTSDVLPLRIDKVFDMRGWVKDPYDDPTPMYACTDISNLFGIEGYAVNEEDIINEIEKCR